MELFRIHGAAYDAFDTTGCMLHEGRWNTVGRRVVYTAEHISLAALEVLVHSESRKFPPKVLTRIHLPDDLEVEQARAMEFAQSQIFGDRWISEERSVVLRVPSAPANNLEHNYLLNPAHPHFPRITHRKSEAFPFDQRLLKLRGLGSV
jgi:RES domain-containing protein